MIWDYECGWITNERYLWNLKKRIEISLKKSNVKYYVGTITAVGPPFGAKRKEFRKYPEIGHLCTSDENIHCDEEGCKIRAVHSHDPADVV